jgi:hypothetical protein
MNAPSYRQGTLFLIWIAANIGPSDCYGSGLFVPIANRYSLQWILQASLSQESSISSPLIQPRVPSTRLHELVKLWVERAASSSWSMHTLTWGIAITLIKGRVMCDTPRFIVTLALYMSPKA